MTLFFLALWAFLWNLVGATLGIIPIGLIFILSKSVSRAIKFFKGLKK